MPCKIKLYSPSGFCEVFENCSEAVTHKDGTLSFTNTYGNMVVTNFSFIIEYED